MDAQSIGRAVAEALPRRARTEQSAGGPTAMTARLPGSVSLVSSAETPLPLSRRSRRILDRLLVHRANRGGSHLEVNGVVSCVNAIGNPLDAGPGRSARPCV